MPVLFNSLILTCLKNFMNVTSCVSFLCEKDNWSSCWKSSHPKLCRRNQVSLSYVAETCVKSPKMQSHVAWILSGEVHRETKLIFVKWRACVHLLLLTTMRWNKCNERVIFLSHYYINTNEIPSELLRENLISSHVKITCYLHMWKYHHCYGFIINRTFQTKKLFK